MAKSAGSESGGGANTLTREEFLEGCRRMAEANQKVDEVRAARNTVRKQLKAKGIELGKLDATLRMADWQRQEVRDHFAVAQQYAEWLGLPVGSQADLFGSMDDSQRRAMDWHGAGRTARLAHKPKAPPSECGEKYIPFWDAGFDLQDFVWNVDAGKAAAKAPAASAGKGASARGRAKKVAGAISPPPVVTTDAAPAGEAGGDDTLPAEDGFGATGFGSASTTH